MEQMDAYRIQREIFDPTAIDNENFLGFFTRRKVKCEGKRRASSMPSSVKEQEIHFITVGYNVVIKFLRGNHIWR